MANIKYNFRDMKIGDVIEVDKRGRNAAYVFTYYNKEYKFKSEMIGTDKERFRLERV